jgi:hypothetical protein
MSVQLGTETNRNELSIHHRTDAGADRDESVRTREDHPHKNRSGHPDGAALVTRHGTTLFDGKDHLVVGSTENKVQAPAATVIRMRPTPIDIGT